MATFDKIKEVLKNGSGRCVIFCGEEPRYVAMTWQEYKKLVNIIEADINPVKSRSAGIPIESELFNKVDPIRSKTQTAVATFNGVDINEIPL